MVLVAATVGFVREMSDLSSLWITFNLLLSSGRTPVKTWFTVDPALRLLHPLQVDLGEHLRLESDGRLTALTPAGERQITLLHLNRPPLVRQRYQVQERRLEQRTHQELRRELALMERRLQRLEHLFPLDEGGISGP